MRDSILDTKELIGYRLLSDEELSTAAATSVKAGGKGGTMAGLKPRLPTMMEGRKHPIS